MGGAGVVGFACAEEGTEGYAAVCVEELGGELESEIGGGSGWRIDVKDGVAFCFEGVGYEAETAGAGWGWIHNTYSLLEELIDEVRGSSPSVLSTPTRSTFFSSYSVSTLSRHSNGWTV